MILIDCPLCTCYGRCVELEDCLSHKITYIIECAKCGAETTEFYTDKEAENAWNKGEVSPVSQEH